MKKYLLVVGVLGVVLLLVGLIGYFVTGLFGRLPTILTAIGLALAIVGAAANARKLQGALSTRSAKFGLNAMMASVIVLAILVLVNFIAAQHKLRIDTTKSKQYSLSDQTRKVLKSLKREVHITAFYKTDEQRAAQDLLSEYGNLSSKVRYEFIDPDRKPAIARRYAITAYNTVVVESGDKEEKITNLSEEDLTNAIIKATREGKKKIYFTEGHGERDIESLERKGYNVAKKELEKLNYGVEKVKLFEKGGVPEDCAVLVVAGPQTDLLPNEQDWIENYLKRGGAAFLLLDPNQAPGMTSLVAKWGIQLGSDVVVDASGIGMLFGTDASMPIVSQYESHPITKDFRVMTIYPLARSVTPAANPPSGLTVQSLGKTSPNSWGETNLYGNQGQLTARFDAGQDLRGPISIAAVATKDAELAPGANEAKKPKSRLVVFGDSDFASNSFFGLQGDGDLFMNTVSWLAEEEDLVAIRPKDIEDRRVNLTNKQAKMILVFGVILLPLTVLGAGVGVYVKRK